MKILIACEFSGIVRDAFIKKGHDVISCDLLDTDSPGPHYKGDVADILDDGFDLMIAHPPCTYLCNSGVSWLYKDIERWPKLFEGAAFFKKLLECNIKKICIENPIPHKYAVQLINKKYTQIIHPWQFGHGESKATCLWLKNLPKLKETKIMKERKQRLHYLPPSKDRWKLRSTTYQGIADAMADQWSSDKYKTVVWN
jgi:hypothetical protein